MRGGESSPVEARSPERSVERAVETVARDAYARVVGGLAVRFRDVCAAEDAVGEALRSALETWPRVGIPNEPVAWLRTVAKRHVLERLRRAGVAGREETLVALATALEEREGAEAEDFGDARLRLCFVCAHPAIDEGIRTALMLQVVLGLDAETIGRVFLVPGPTIGQRLVRAKRKIRDAGIPFEPPTPEERGSRLHAVLEAVYAAFGTDEPMRVEEGIYLAELLAKLLPDEPEALGLLALVRFREARRKAGRDAEGRFVPLSEQDPSGWDRAAILRADVLLREASSFRRPGPFQLEAAIQSAHCQRLFSGRTPWRSIATLYRALRALQPTVGATIAEAVARVELGELDRAEAIVAELPAVALVDYGPYHLFLAHLAEKRGDGPARRSALDRAIALVADVAIRSYLTA